MSGVPPPKLPFHNLNLSLHHLAIQFWSVDFWFRTIIKIVARSRIFKALHQILFRLGQWALPGSPENAYSAPSALAEPREVWEVTTLVENMGFAICRNLHRKKYGAVGWGRN